MATKQPNSHYCFACGLENPGGLRLKFYETAPGEVTSEFVVPEKFQGYPGVVHGGIVAAMLDEIAGRSHIRGDPPRFMFSARLDVRFRGNVPTGQLLRLVGRAGKTKTRTATATAYLFGPDGKLLAEANVLLMDVPAEMKEEIDFEALGWKVYPE